jgi:glutamyl-Q tRNA(Asp) synthetase
VCQRDCRSRQGEVTTPAAIRISVPKNCVIGFDDTLQGPQGVALGQTSGDFLIHRKDGLYAYQLAVVVDDAHQGITHIVRGSDLLDTTVWQIFLQQALDYATPVYSHIPVITNSAGQKFSKQHHATALQDEDGVPNLRSALEFLCQPRPPAQLTSPAQLLQFAVQNWTPSAIPSRMAIVAGCDNT